MPHALTNYPLNRGKASLAALGVIFVAMFQLHSQGYIVPNGVFIISPPEISVVHNPASPTNGGSYTGFFFQLQSANTFTYQAVVDVGVRVFLVSLNDPISLQAIQTQGYTEFGYAPNYVFNNGVPFYVGLYTGNDRFAPQRTGFMKTLCLAGRNW